MKKKAFGSIAMLLALVASVMCAACLVACGDDTGSGGGNNGAEYEFVKTETSGDMEPVFGSMYAKMFAGSVLTKTDKEITFTMQDGKQICSYTKEGDKYVLGGKWLEQQVEAMNPEGQDIMRAVMNGYDTDEGFMVEMIQTIYDEDGQFLYVSIDVKIYYKNK